jgi:hypothetical protein
MGSPCEAIGRGWLSPQSSVAYQLLRQVDGAQHLGREAVGKELHDRLSGRIVDGQRSQHGQPALAGRGLLGGRQQQVRIRQAQGPVAATPGDQGQHQTEGARHRATL